MMPVRYVTQLVLGICYAGVICSCVVMCEAVTVPVRCSILSAVPDDVIRLLCVSMAARNYLCKVSVGDCDVFEICFLFCCLE